MQSKWRILSKTERRKKERERASFRRIISGCFLNAGLVPITIATGVKSQTRMWHSILSGDECEPLKTYWLYRWCQWPPIDYALSLYRRPDPLPSPKAFSSLASRNPQTGILTLQHICVLALCSRVSPTPYCPCQESFQINFTNYSISIF